MSPPRRPDVAPGRGIRPGLEVRPGRGIRPGRGVRPGRSVQLGGAQPGRGVAGLLADFGHPLPGQRSQGPFAPATGPAADLLVGRRGRREPGAGWAAVPAPLATYLMTSEQVGGVWPLIGGDALPATGALMGLEATGGAAFYADPVAWTLAGTAGVSNPNVMVFGAPGQGKSATVKVFCLRMMAAGYRVLVLGDVKDEYEPLCAALRVTPHAVGPGLAARINPLDPGPLGRDWTRLPATEARRRAAIVFNRWLQLLAGLVGSQHVAFDPTAATAVGHALADLTGRTAGATALAPVTIPELWRALDDPADDLVGACRYAGRRHFLDDTRAVRDALGALVSGPLAGLFDAATTIEVDWAAPIQSLSLSRLDHLGDAAVGIALTCLNSWGRAMTEVAAPGDLRIVIRDEAWKQLRLGVAAVASLDADLRLSRRDGCVQVVVAHKPSDLLAVGDAGSQATAIARDLLHLCATKVLLGQDERIGQDLSGLLGLTPITEHAVTGWATAGRGRALWIVGNRPFKVATVRSVHELALTDTDTALTAPAGPLPPATWGH